MTKSAVNAIATDLRITVYIGRNSIEGHPKIKDKPCNGMQPQVTTQFGGQSTNEGVQKENMRRVSEEFGDQNFRWDKALETAAAIEDEGLSRKFSLRK